MEAHDVSAFRAAKFCTTAIPNIGGDFLGITVLAHQRLLGRAITQARLDFRELAVELMRQRITPSEYADLQSGALEPNQVLMRYFDSEGHPRTPNTCIVCDNAVSSAQHRVLLSDPESDIWRSLCSDECVQAFEAT